MHANQQSNGSGIPMPLIMTYTPYTRIEEKTEIANVAYDDSKQSVVYNMRTIGTRCLQSSTTRKKKQGAAGHILVVDKKNAIDDSKSVK